MDNYNETLISRYLKSDKISPTFINKIKKYFPEADVNYLINNNTEEINDLIEKGGKLHKARSQELIDEIESRLKELKQLVARR